MFFGELPIDQAIGARLAHSYKSSQGRIRKGQLLTAAHVEQMRSDGVTHVTVARLSANDVHEDAAALAVAEALAGDNLRLGDSSTGRVNLHAEDHGLFNFEPSIIHALNRVDECITVATLAPDTRVVAGQIVATVKIIPYAVASTSVASAIDTVTKKLDLVESLSIAC